MGFPLTNFEMHVDGKKCIRNARVLSGLTRRENVQILIKCQQTRQKKQRMLEGKSSNKMMKRNKRKHFLDITLMSISAFNHNHQKQDSIKTTPKTICQVSGKVSISIT